MPGKLMTAEDWSEYIALFEKLNGRLQPAPWFRDGWVTQFRHTGLDNRVIFLLYKEHWFGGAIYFKTRITNADLEKNLIRVGLYVETSMPKHGISRVAFDKALFEGGGDLIRSWEGYVVKPADHGQPFHVWIPFTKENLVARLEAEFSRVQGLGAVIDQAIGSAKTAA